MAHRPRAGDDRSERGQTSIDFLIGAAVFLLAVTFVFAVIPGMIDPFSEGQEETLVADRVATQLAESMLGEGDTPSELNTTCTVAFFNSSAASGAACSVPFNESDAGLSSRVGIDERYRLNITLQRDLSGDSATEILCVNGDGVGTCTGDSTRLAGGPVPPRSTESITSARRTVFLEGNDLTLVVRLW